MSIETVTLQSCTSTSQETPNIHLQPEERNKYITEINVCEKATESDLVSLHCAHFQRPVLQRRVLHVFNAHCAEGAAVAAPGFQEKPIIASPTAVLMQTLMLSWPEPRSVSMWNRCNHGAQKKKRGTTFQSKRTSLDTKSATFGFFMLHSRANFRF